jgi:5-methylcytosine-specific restriction endonuclease McrA
MRAFFVYWRKFSARKESKLVMGHEVLLLNANYEPLNVCTMRRAMSLLLLGKAEVLEQREKPLQTIRGKQTAPSVLKMRYPVRRPMPKLRLSRHSILARDNYTCQYCGVKGKDLTIDHVHPRWAGGPQTWDNLVACCRKCNLKKGDKTPAQANMKLARKPRRPHFVPYLSLPVYLRAKSRRDWEFYLPVFEEFAREPA